MECAHKAAPRSTGPVECESSSSSGGVLTHITQRKSGCVGVVERVPSPRHRTVPSTTPHTYTTQYLGALVRYYLGMGTMQHKPCSAPRGPPCWRPVPVQCMGEGEGVRVLAPGHPKPLAPQYSSPSRDTPLTSPSGARAWPAAQQYTATQAL